MSFFAVLNSSADTVEKPFQVSRLHLNLWSLAAIGARRRMFLFDVGVEIHADESGDAVTEISLALPFDTLGPRSLIDKVQTPKIAGLIFDSKIAHLEGGRIGINDQEALKPVDVRVREATRDRSYTAKGFTLWKLPLSTPIEPGSSGYVRLRFPVLSTGRTWQWTKTRFFAHWCSF